MLRKIYIWFPEDKYRGRLIGPGGQNISTIEYITGVDVQPREDHWVIVHETENSDAEMASHIIWTLFKDGVINPLRIIKLADKYRRDQDSVGLFDHLELGGEDE